MHPQATVDRARQLSQQGLFDREVAQIVGVPLSVVQNTQDPARWMAADYRRAVPGRVRSGLFHSDGYRGVNRIRRRWGNSDHWYEYPRCLFVNESADILGLCGQTLDRLGVEWRFSKPNTISVAKRDAVARLDESVGPKY
jgi:hypothetical protein